MSANDTSSTPAGICSFLARTSQRATASGLGQLLARVMLGVVFAFHGSQKLFGWFDGPGVAGAAGFFEKLGIPFPTLNVYLAAGTEFFGGLLLIAGLLARPVSLALSFTMIVAALTAHRSAFSLQHGGMEYALTLAVVSLGLALIGPGRLSLDRQLKLPIA